MRAAAAAVLVLLLALPAWAAQPRRATLKLAGARTARRAGSRLRQAESVSS